MPEPCMSPPHKSDSLEIESDIEELNLNGVHSGPSERGLMHASSSVSESEMNDELGDLPPPFPTSPAGSCPPAAIRPSSSARDTLDQYRPSDLDGIAAATRPSVARDSLMVGRQTDMTATLGELDENYRVSVQTKLEAEKELAPLLVAAKKGDMHQVQTLIDTEGVDVAETDTLHGQTALHLAVRNGHISVVKILCVPGILESVLNVADTRKNTALHLAAVKSRRITKVLLDNGADVELYNSRNQTPLGVHLLTTKKDDPILAEMLLQHGADPNCCVGDDSNTALHVAVDRSLFEIACRLVRHGARLDMKDEYGKMVFDKVNRKMLRKLLAKISFPPVWVPNEDRTDCMICSKKFSKLAFGVRRHHCRHCGRIVCGECAHLSVESVRFPTSFNNRLKAGAKANHVQRRVCKTCFAVFKERQAAESSAGDKESGRASKFYKRVVGYTWDEVDGQVNNPISR